MKWTLHLVGLAGVLFVLGEAYGAESKAGENPADHLPPHIAQVTWFGERADWSQDGKKILFLTKTFGDAMEIDLATKHIQNLTAHFPHSGYTRALYLANGDILLSGPEKFDPQHLGEAREQCWLYVLDKNGTKRPVPLGTKCSEGPAVSRHRLHLAWTHVAAQYPESMPAGASRMQEADIVFQDGTPKLANEKLIVESKDLPFKCTMETQNFRPPEETELTFSAYGYQGTDVMGIDLITKKIVNYSNSPGQYDEPEGIFPDGQYTLVECDKQNRKGSGFVDLWKLKLDGSGAYERLTYFSDYPGFKASNPVVSDDGKFIAFQMARSREAAGVGHGIFVYDIERAKKSALMPGPSDSSQATLLTPNDVLSIRGGRFFLEGEPFAEISFNKYDLFWQLYDQAAEGKPLNESNPQVQAQEKALRNLHELGFKTIRIFALPWGPAGPASYEDPEKRKNLYAALDKTLDLCDAQGIRVVWSLSAASFTDTKLDPAKGWVYGEEQERELIANAQSRGRKLLYRYIDETVARYRQRKAVVMWEISNEVTLLADIGDANRVYNGERMPTLKDVAGFFEEVAQRIKSADPLRLVCSGGSNMRESQWHLFQGQGWKTDTFDDQLKCFELLYARSAVDVIDIHSYPDNKPGYAISGADGHSLWLDNKGYMTIAKRLNKPLMIGELGLRAVAKKDKKVWDETPDYFESYDDSAAAKPWLVKTLNDVIEAQVPLSYWWCYQSDNPDERRNGQHFDIDWERNPELVTCVVEANKRLKAKLGIAR